MSFGNFRRMVMGVDYNCVLFIMVVLEKCVGMLL